MELSIGNIYMLAAMGVFMCGVLALFWGYMKKQWNAMQEKFGNQEKRLAEKEAALKRVMDRLEGKQP